MATPRSPFLDLPTELRLLIYNFVLLDSRVITIGTAKVQGKPADVIHRLHGGGRIPFPAIPLDHEPVVDAEYNPALLSFTDPAVIPVSPDTPDPPRDFIRRVGSASLLLTNKQIHKEFRSHFNLTGSKTTSLFLQYPYGLHVCKVRTPKLLAQARSVHLAGAYKPRDFSVAHAAYLPRRLPFGQGLEHNGGKEPDSSAEMANLIRAMFGPSPSQPVAKFEMRVYFPGGDSYSTVWGDDSSPIVIALRNSAAAEISIEVWRGRYGTGVYLAAKPVIDRKRSVSTVWRKLEEGRTGEPRCGSWVLDPLWPDWQEEYEMSSGPKGDMIVSTPVE